MTLYETLGVRSTATADEIKSAYRKLAAEHHPDRNPGDAEAAARFRRVSKAYAVLSDPEARARYDRFGSTKQVVIRSKASTYTVAGELAHGDLASILAAEDSSGRAVVLKGVLDPRNDDLLANEADRLRALHDTKRDNYKRYLPTFVDSFRAFDSHRIRRRVNVLERLDGWHTLAQVASRMPRIRFEHGVWMLNRILEILGYVHRQGILHGAIVPEHLMVFSSGATDSKWDHGLKLIDWCYSVS